MRRQKVAIAVLLSMTLILQGNFVFGALKDDIAGMNDDILNKKKQIQDLDVQIKSYQQKITQEESKSASLSNSIAIIKNKIDQIGLKIDQLNLSIDTSGLEIKALESTIGDKQLEIDKQKTVLGGLVTSLNQLDHEDALRLLILNDSLSSIFNQIKYLEEVQSNLLTSLSKLKGQKSDLEDKNKDLTIKRNLLSDQKKQLEEQTSLLQEQKNANNLLIKISQSKQNQFKDIINELRSEQKQATDDIANISKEIKDKIKNSDQYKIGTAVILSWPVDSSRGISCYFHDPDYPFRSVMEHTGIDIRAPQGTTVRAAAPGYVVNAHDGGYGYSYIILAHFDGTYTLYGHVSRIDVKKNQYVERGDIIGLSGGTPGTRGAGPYVTGPHLHFEARNKNNIPVNPLDHLINIY